MTFTVPFSELKKSDIPNAGGKGANLGEMTTSGFPVPDGFVLTTNAYADFVQKNLLQAQILALANTVTMDDPQSSEAASAKIKALFLEAQIPQEIVDALSMAIKPLGDAPVAVRSSATAEDLPNASFAGQQDSYLNVIGKDALLDAVKNCWASLWTARAISYRLKQKISPDDVKLAVVVQKLIDADVSGVAFSLNPNNNDYDEALINSNFGLGESIVSGQVTPDLFVVNKVSKKIIEKQLSNKDFVLVSKNGGGIEQSKSSVPNDASLTDAQVLEVSKLVTAVEAHYELPMDIEWAYQNAKLYLLQARPITSYVPLPEMMVTQPGAEKYLYLDVIVLTQGFQESLSVMGIELFGKMLETIKGDMGFFDRGMDGGVLNIDGRQYMHLSNLMKGLGMKITKSMFQSYDTPTRQIIESIDLASYRPAKKPAPMRGIMWNAMKYMARAIVPTIQGLCNADKAEERYLETFDDHVELSKKLITQDLSFSDLVSQYFDLFNQQMAGSMSVLAPAMIAQKNLKKRFKDDDVDALLLALMIDLNGNPTAEMGRLMFDLAKHPEIQETSDGEAFALMHEKKAFSPEFQKAYDAYMEKFGCRCIREIDIATPRPYDNVAEFFKQLKAFDINNDIQSRSSKRRKDAYDKLLALAKQKGKAKTFKKLVKSQDNMGYREKPKYFFIIVLDLIRQRALEMGKTLVDKGRIDSANQVFDLKVDQLTQAQADDTLDIRKLIAQNLAPREKQARVKNWPRIIDSRGRIMRNTREPAKDGDIMGDPIAPGIVRGIANVLHSPYEKPLKKGDILVTRATDPGWTPLFMNAGGIVLEIGGALQHGAVIAREYGLPCVSGIENATSRIPDGAMIEVDGSTGIVRIIDDETATKAP